MEFKHLLSVRADDSQVKRLTATLAQAERRFKQLGLSTKGINQVGLINRRVTISQGKALIATSQKFKNANGNIVSISKSTGKATGMMADFSKAMKRVLVVVPVWLLMRTALMGFLRTLTGGMEYWRKFSSAMMKAKGVIHTTSITIGEAYDRLAEGVKKLSIETGEAMADLTSAFYRFGTVGLDFETSMLGIEASTKASMAMFGNVDSYARTLALSYKLLGDTIDKTIPPNERLMSVSAKLYGLWQKNAFEVNDFTQSLMNFLPTANTMNLTLDETISLLSAVSTGAVQGARGGRLLRTSFAKLMENIDTVATSLGLLVDLRVERPFDVFIRVLNEISALTRSGDLEKASESVREIFGGVRGGQVVRALVAMEEVLKDNTELLERGRYDELMAKFRDRVEDVTDELDRQMKIMGNLRKQIGMTFLQAVFGGEKFEETLKNINKFLETANVRGKVFYDTWAGIMSLGIVPIINLMARETDKYAENLDKVTKALSKQLSLEEMNILIHELETERLSKLQLKYGVYANNLDTILERLRTIRMEVETTIPEVKYTAGVEGMGDPFQPPKPPVPITVGTETRLKLDELKESLKYKKMEAQGVNKTIIAEQKLLNYIKKRVEVYNKLKSPVGEIKEIISTEEILSKALAGNYNAILELTKKRIIGEDEILGIQKLINKVHEERLKLIKKYSNDFRKATKEGLQDLLKGGELDSFIDRMKEKLTDMWAESMSERILKPMEGIFGKVGGIFAGIEDPLLQGFNEGALITYNSIVKGFSDANRGMAIGGAPTGAGGGAGGGYPGGYAPAGYADPTSAGGAGGGSMFGKMGGWGTVAGIGMGYAQGGTRGALQGGMMGIGSALMMVNPILGGLMMLGSMFMGKKKKSEQRTSTWQPKEAGEMFPNLGIDIAPLPKQYALPSSRAFGSGGMGGINININIDKIEGKDEKIAQIIGDKVKREVITVVNTKYGRDLIRGLTPGMVL